MTIPPDSPSPPFDSPPSPPAAPPPPGAPRRGRVKIWLLVGAVVVVGALLVSRRQPAGRSSGLPPGGGEVELTLVTSDRNDVDCAASKGVDRYRCGFADDATTPVAGGEADRLRPYMTPDRHLYLIPGLFLEPAVERRYQSEVPAPNKAREQLRRFTVRCKLKPVGSLAGFKLRWLASSTWSPPQTADVATVDACKVEG